MKFFILKFKDDKKIAKKVARDYIENSQEHDDDNEFEINIIISNLYGRDCDDIRENKNLLSARLMYEELKINYFIQSEKNSDDFNDYNQMGFNIFNMMYENRKIIVDYIAKKMVEEIFGEEEFSLEELLQNKYNKKSDLDKDKPINFILKYISTYDTNLSNYIKDNISLVDNLKKRICKIAERFDEYNSRKTDEIYEWIIDYLYDRSKSNEDLPVTLLIKCIAENLNINNEIITSAYEEYNYLLENINCDKLKEKKEYKEIKKIVEKIIKTNKLPDNDFKEREIRHRNQILIKKHGKVVKMRKKY